MNKFRWMIMARVFRPRLSHFSLLALAGLLLVLPRPALADCEPSRDCAGCGTAPSGIEVRCKCKNQAGGKVVCSQCTCVDPECNGSWEEGSCCCTKPGGGQSCVYIACSRGSSASNGAQWPQGLQLNVQGLPPLALTDVHVSLVGDTLADLAYTLHNQGSLGLVVAEIWWDLYTERGSTRVVSWVDGWITEAGVLRPGGSYSEDVNVEVRSAAKFQRVSVTIGYVEFRDGSSLGAPSQPGLFAQRKREMRQTYERLLNVYQTQGEQAFRSALGKRVEKETGAMTAARVRLSGIYDKGGLQSGLAEIERLLAVP